MIRQRKPITPDKATIRLEELCARSEQCTADARKKLQTWGITSTDTEKIISSLIAKRFIDDERFCHAYVRDKFRFSKWGKRKIKMSLIMKRLDRSIIEKALETIDDKDYIDCLQYIISSKAKSMADADSYDGRTRLFRFAVSRGFEPELISKVLRRMADSN